MPRTSETLPAPSDEPDTGLRSEYVEGLHALEEWRWKRAARCFEAAARAVGPADSRFNRYLAAQGYAQVRGGEIGGVNLCRRALAAERRDATVFEFAARAYLHLGQRALAWESVEKGLRRDPLHIGLKRLLLEMGVRRPPVVSFLSRNHPINVALGKWRSRRHSAGVAGHDIIRRESVGQPLAAGREESPGSTGQGAR